MTRSNIMKFWKLLTDAKFTGRRWGRTIKKGPEAFTVSSP